ncbi:MAG: alpha-(1-_3)-arabinofuranosyltransferase family protein, partial [Marmoricola sp.]
MRAPSTAPDRVTWHFRLVTCCLVLVAVTFAQRPGRLIGDTKLDLVVNPAGILARSLHLWDPQGGFGQVQNQAYGYLFPMGPFFWLGDVLSVPGWAIQRLWWSLLLVVAFLGVVKLAGSLGLGSPTSRILAAFAYALSPRILTLLGPISIEAWPSAVAPWVLVPLVLGAQRGSPRSAALLSALAVAAVGGVNAAATFAVIPLGAVWLLTREPGPRRRALMVWWPVFVLVGTAWWLVPLLLLGRFSPPFLDYIETASFTTFPTTLFDALRGTSHWVPYVDPTWQAGNDLLSTSYIALNTGVLVLLGVVGITLAQNPHRRFLVISTFVGLLAVTAGHNGAVQGWFGGSEREALDGVLAPLRNVHKFDLVIRLPLVLGLAHLVSVMAERTALSVRRAGSRARTPADVVGDRLVHVGVLLLCAVSVVGVASPALTGRLGAAHDFEAVPGYWSKTADWLGEHAQGTTAVLVPGSSFGYYLWGDPDDEPMQPLASSPWAVRNAVPLAPAGNIRMLDALEARLASGRPSDGLAGYLRRAGIGHLVVRNDLRAGGEPAPVLVHQALDGSPGIRRVVAFGPRLGNPARLSGKQRDVVVDDGWTKPYPAVEIYEVSGASRAVVAAGGPLVVGGPEDLLGLTEAGLLGEEPTVLAADAPADLDHQGLVLTDGLRRRETNFARIQEGKSATLEGTDEGRRGAPARDYTLGDDRWETRARILGVRAVSASSSRAFADTPGAVIPEALPFAAFDGLLDTAWRSGPPQGGTPWVGIELEGPRSVDSIVVVLDGEPGDKESAARIRVETDSGSSRTVLAQPAQPVTIPLPSGRTSSLKVYSAEGPERELAIAEIQVPGVDVDRTLELPVVPARWGAPDSILLDSTSGWRAACVDVGEDVRCGAGRGRVGEEPGALDRTLRLGTGASYQVSAAAAPVDGEALQGMIQRDQLVNVSASTTAVADARASAVAAVDGDPGTTWVAAADDEDPTLSVRWLGQRTVRAVSLTLDRQAAASRPTRVELVYPSGRQSVDLGADGTARVRPFRAGQVDVRITRVQRTSNL